MATPTPPVPPRPFDDYDRDKQQQQRQNSGPPPIPPLPPNFKTEPQPPFVASAPHFEDPLVAPRPHKLQPDLPANMARTLHDQLSSPYPPQDNPVMTARQTLNLTPGFAMPTAFPSRGPSPLPPPQGSDWSPWTAGPGGYQSPPIPQQQQSYPAPYPLQPSAAFPSPYNPRHEDSVASSFSALSFHTPPLQPNHGRTSSAGGYQPPYPSSSPPSQPPQNPPASNTPSLTAPLPTIPALTAALPTVQQPDSDPARKITWAKDVLSLVNRANHFQSTSSVNAPNVNSTDIPVGPVQISDPQLQRLVDVALPLIQQIAGKTTSTPLPVHVTEAIYLKATCEASGAFPRVIPHNPRIAFRDFEAAAKGGYFAAWFKLGRDYENFGDVKHAKDCFERGVKYGVESCLYRMGMAHLMGQLGLSPSPDLALPFLQRAATLASVDVPQPAYVYALLLLNEFSQITIPPHIIASLIPPGSSPQAEARKHLERAAYLNFSPAQYKLGHCYEFATPPFPFDALLSVQYYSLASQQGEIEADMALSKWFLCGAEGAFEKDEGLAWTFADKAAKKGLPSAEFAMGYYAEVGVGGPKDIEAARKWYNRASQHGNTDATERLQALSQPTPQALSRQQHEALADTTLVRRRTQAKQRSDAIGAAPPPIPLTQSQRIVEQVRKNSTMIAVGYGAPSGPPPSSSYGAPQTNSPTGLNNNVRLPPVDERTAVHTPKASQSPPFNPHSTSPRTKPISQPPPSGSPAFPSAPGSGAYSNQPPFTPPQQQFAGAPRYSLVDPGSGSSPSPRPNNVGGGGLSNNTPFRPPRQHSVEQRPPPASSQGSEQGGQVISPPSSKPQHKGPQTFAEMGITGTKVEDKDCVIM
ncbi:Chitin Synthase Regulator [Abortiporus biennis]